MIRLNKALELFKTCLPFIVSQSDRASEAYHRHKARAASVDLSKEEASLKLKSQAKARDALLKRLVDVKNEEEKLEILQRLEYVEGMIRQGAANLRALDYLPANFKITKPIEDHWIDKFNDLARKRNEDWRSDLLARALAQEVAEPGSVSPRELWLIGNLEEKLFTALAELLNLCFWIHPDNSPVIADSQISACERIIVNNSTTVGKLAFLLGDTGIISDILLSRKMYNANENFIVKYGGKTYKIITKQNLQISGVLFTPLGESISRFFKPTSNLNGETILHDWIQSISKEAANVVQIHESAAKGSPLPIP